MKPPRFRLSTLILLVIILALALTLVIDRWKREQERRQAGAERDRVLAEGRVRGQEGTGVPASSARAGTLPAADK
jgi:hypothetical protein